MPHTDANEALVARLLAGDMTARDELIVVNQPLVYVTVTRILRHWPASSHLRDELIGAGSMALVAIVDNLVTTGDVKRPIRNYLITAIRNDIISELRQHTRYYKVHHHVDSYAKLPEECLVVEDAGLKRLENLEYLHVHCKSPQERQVLELFLQGNSRRDIAQRLQVPYNVVCDILAAYTRRVRRKEN
jgi:RNA polymerase sigma factor (sigma-70 family)